MSEERQHLLKQQEALEQKLKALERKEKKKYAEDYAVVEKQLADIIKIKKNDSKKEKTTNLKNKIITAPTQVGKTKAIIELCKNCNGWLSVISCDNKSDQMKQLLGRVKQEQINAYSLKDVIKKTKTVKNHLDNNENVIIVMLNNESQVSSLTAFFEKLMLIVAVKKYICIHDESDMVNKSDNITDLHNQKIAKSHREWIKHFHIVKGLKVPVMRRIWVTATAENCSNLYDICGKDIIVIPTPSQYRPVNTHISWDGESEEELSNEIERIRTEKSKEIILYCSERLIADQLTMAKYVSEKYNCVSIVYNSKTTKVLGVKNPFETKKPINHLLSLNKGIKPIVIFGSELMNRGISFIGKGFNPSTATVMFYKGGLKSHVIGLVQKIGRITGTSRPDLNNRKLYCSQEVYDNYKAYIENQKAVYAVIKNNPELNMNSILETVNSVRLTRPVDRPTLKKVNKDYFYASDITSNSNNSEDDSGFEEPRNNIDKMKKFVDSWRKPENKTQIATLFKEMVANGGSILSNRVKELFGDGRGEIHQLTSNHMNWNAVFYKDDTTHYIKEEAMNYYHN